jgi:ABC-type multidrug transport system fused ATPase/permease subunit
MTRLKTLDSSETPKRSPTEIINQAIAENRQSEFLLYIYSTVLVLAGSAALLYGVWAHQPITMTAGVCSSSLFIPAMHYARRIRKENMAIRLLEVPLTRADTAAEAAQVLKEHFIQTHNENAGSVRRTEGRKTIANVPPETHG